MPIFPEGFKTFRAHYDLKNEAHNILEDRYTELWGKYVIGVGGEEDGVLMTTLDELRKQLGGKDHVPVVDAAMLDESQRQL